MATTPSLGEPLRIGLTGGIGSGKSTVAKLLQAYGAAIVDTDAIARQLTESGGAAIPVLREAFGDSVMASNGALDRNRMRRLAFNDPAARQRLEGILHPMILAETERLAARLTAAPVIVFDVPLLVESGRRWLARVHRVLVVDCSEDTQIERVMNRSGWSADAVRSVIGAQATRNQRRVVADDLIVNDQISELDLADQVAALWRSWGAVDAAPV